jgi:hypothetical protein
MQTALSLQSYRPDGFSCDKRGMSNLLLILSYVAKAAGFVATLNALPFVSPSTGVIIFFVASLLKDTVDRIGDFLDNGKPDWRS